MPTFTGRKRVILIVVASVCAVALVGTGLRYLIVRHDRQSTESSVAALTRATNRSLRLLRAVSDVRDDVDRRNDAARLERDQVRAAAALLHTELDKALAETTSSSIEAFVSGAQANNVAACLVGVSQALNQLSVGDGGAIGSLQAVEGPCRQAGLAT
jgi:hypothetical protein